ERRGLLVAFARRGARDRRNLEHDFRPLHVEAVRPGRAASLRTTRRSRRGTADRDQVDIVSLVWRVRWYGVVIGLPQLAYRRASLTPVKGSPVRRRTCDHSMMIERSSFHSASTSARRARTSASRRATRSSPAALSFAGSAGRAASSDGDGDGDGDDGGPPSSCW